MKRLYLVVLVSLAMSAGAFAQGAVLSGNVVRCSSSVIFPSATLRVGTSTATGTGAAFAPLASLYSDSALTTPVSQPTTADICGDFAAGGTIGTTLYLAPGEYIVQITGTGLTEKKVHVTVGGANHNLLSSTHADVTPAAVQRGDIITGQAGPLFKRKALGASGRALKSDGTDVVYSSTAMGGAGDCSGSNQVVQDINPDAVPDCLTVGTSNVSNGLRDNTRCASLFDPVAGDSGRIQWELPVNVTITRIYSNVKAATSVTWNLNKRAEATPDVAGTDVLSAGLVADTNGQTSCSAGCDVNTITSAAWTAHTPLALTISAVTGTPDTFRACFDYRVDTAQ